MTIKLQKPKAYRVKRLFASNGKPVSDTLSLSSESCPPFGNSDDSIVGRAYETTRRKEEAVSWNVWYVVDDLRYELKMSLEQITQDLEHLNTFADELGERIESLQDELKALKRYDPEEIQHERF